MAEGIITICVIGLFVCGIIAIVYGGFEDCWSKFTHIFVLCLLVCALITTVIVSISFGKSYTEEDKQIEATVIKVESQTFESSVKYKIWAQDTRGEIWEIDANSSFYAITHENDPVIVNYKIVHYWNTTTTKIVSLTKGG